MAATVRLRLIRTVPAVRGRALQIQSDAQREIAGHLHRAFPAELDEVSAAALVGAFIGAVSGALQVLLDDPDPPGDPSHLRRQLHHATDIALRPWQ
jgi:MftR C-terminal domain